MFAHARLETRTKDTVVCKEGDHAIDVERIETFAIEAEHVSDVLHCGKVIDAAHRVVRPISHRR